MKLSAAQWIQLKRLKRYNLVMKYEMVVGVLFVCLSNGGLYLIMENGEII